MKKLFFAALSLLLPFCLSAQSSMKPSQVNVFKNGTYFIVKEGTVKCNNSKALMEIPAGPLLGTYWLNTTKDIKIQQVTFRPDTLKSRKRARSLDELLSANIGKKVKLTFAQSERNVKEITGKLTDFYRETGVLKLQTQDGKNLFMNWNSITELLVDDATIGEFYTADSIANLARIQFSKPADNVDMRVMYMHGGIQWIPSYNIKVLNDKELFLEMKALVENYSEDIMDADLTVTMGTPQFFYGSQLDPIAFGYLTGIGGLYQQPAYKVQLPASNVFQTQVTGAYTVTASDANGAVNEPVWDFESSYTTEGEKTNDLFMYKLGKVSLYKNSKTWFQVFASNVPYKDVYEVKIYDVVNYCSNRYIGNDPEQRFDVFHSFKLTNTTGNPLTTGSVFVLNEKMQPLAQDQLKYTPVQADAMVQLSKAADVNVKNTEEEITKVDGFKRVGRTIYNKVTIKGSIQVENLQDKKINLNITKNLTALILEASDGGKIKKSGKYYNQNPYSEIKWEIPLNAGEKKTITYQYDVLVN